MSPQTFKADAPQRLAPYAAKLLLPVAGLVVVSILTDTAAWVSGAVAVIGCCLTALAVVGRSSWGDRLVIDPGGIVLLKSDHERLRIPLRAVTRVQVKRDVVAIAWSENDKRRTIVIGSERFTPETWRRLAAAMSSLGAGNQA